MNSQALFPTTIVPISPRYMHFDRFTIKSLMSQRNKVISEVGYPKIEELSALFTEEMRDSYRKTCSLEKRKECKVIGQVAFDAYNKVAKNEKVAFLCLVLYFYMFKEKFPNLDARGLEMSWKFVGGKDPETIWIG